jgi:hypothetical protein
LEVNDHLKRSPLCSLVYRNFSPSSYRKQTVIALKISYRWTRLRIDLDVSVTWFDA